MKTRWMLGLVLGLLGCAGRNGDDGDAHESHDEARLNAACEAWCEVAVECSVYYASPEWFDFSTSSECEEACIGHALYVTQQNDVCFGIVLNDRECSARLTCEEFESYENWSSGRPATQPVPCLEEIQAHVESCNL